MLGVGAGQGFMYHLPGWEEACTIPDTSILGLKQGQQWLGTQAPGSWPCLLLAHGQPDLGKAQNEQAEKESPRR